MTQCEMVKKWTKMEREVEAEADRGNCKQMLCMIPADAKPERIKCVVFLIQKRT